MKVDNIEVAKPLTKLAFSALLFIWRPYASNIKSRGDKEFP